MRFNKGLFFVLLGAAVAVTLFQRAFPSQDGPLHLYYADVLANLLRGSGAYSHAFEIKHLFPPYAFEPYLLVALSALLPPLVAEKVVVALAIVGFALGFRYLVHAIDPGNELIPLAAVPLATNKLLYMGFYNYSLGVAAAFFAMGFWLRHYDRLTPRRTAGFLALILLLVSMHPVALFIALMFVALHLTLVLWGRVRAARGAVLERVRTALTQSARAVACALVSASTLLWLLAFRSAGEQSGSTFHEPPRILQLLKLNTVSPFTSGAYRGVLALMVGILVLGAAARVWKARRTLTAPEWAAPAMALACAVAFVAVPWEVNGRGGAHFPDRFPIFAIVLAAATAAGLPRAPISQKRWTALACLVVMVTLGWQAMLKQRVLNDLRPVYESPVPRRALTAALVASIPMDERNRTAYNYLPDYWAAAHYIRRAHANFLNAAWLDAPIMMLKPRVEGRCSYSDAFPMLQCLSAGTSVAPDLLLAADDGADDSPAVRLARSLGMEPRPFASPLLRLFARPEVLPPASAVLRKPGPGPR
ncbi:MAG TPA: hypothetical protein VF767_12185 [Bryobacteraceae bacterium]